MNKQIYIGIDGGLSGGLSVIQDNNILELIVMPVLNSTKSKREYDIYTIIEFFKKYPTATVILEKTHALPKLGVVQAHQLGKGSGIMIGILSALKMRYHIIHSKTWQSKILRDVPGDNTKSKSIIVSQRLFPTIDFTRTERSKKIDHNLCDATLLAFYGQTCVYEK